MRRYLIPLFAGNAVALASIAVSYVVYSRLLTAQEFGAYAAALAVGNLAVLVLDGGIRTSIIKHATALTRAEEGVLLKYMLAFSALLLLALFFGQTAVGRFYPAASTQTGFVALFAAVYLVTYPWIGLSTAALERSLAYSHIAWIESIGVVFERAAPAFFILLGHFRLGAFVIGLMLGRAVRIILLARLHSVSLVRGPGASFAVVRSLLKEGLWFQLGGAASLVRDNLHVIIVGPLFGALWVGYYAWALQLCTLASAIFVQISSRVSLSVTARSTQFSERWSTVARQLATLTAITAPILAAVILAAPNLDHMFFGDKWHPALTLLPLLCARMIPGIASAPVGMLLLVERGASKYAMALWVWTALELAAAYAAVKLIGSYGLAVSYAIAAWFGVFVLAKGIGVFVPSLFVRICSIILRRPALWLSTVVAGVFIISSELSGRSSQVWVASVCGLLLATVYWVDSDTHTALRGRRA
jgi:O-antigen/teichoic acid export membrane protein